MSYKVKGKKLSINLVVQNGGMDGLEEQIPWGYVGRHISWRTLGSTETVEVKDLSTIPFPYVEEDMIDLEHKIIYYESSRGMPILLSVLAYLAIKIQFGSSHRREPSRNYNGLSTIR